jgi:predicted ATPase
MRCGLVVVCTVNDRTETHSKDLGSTLREIEGAGASIHRIALTNLDLVQVQHLLVKALEAPDELVGSLAHWILVQTKGNPSEVIELMCWLREVELLWPDPDTGSWSWDVDEIEMTLDNREVGDLLRAKLDSGCRLFGTRCEPSVN